MQNQRDPNNDGIFKVITIGDAGKFLYYCSETMIGCGKSCLLKRLVKNQFIEDQVTVGVEF